MSTIPKPRHYDPEDFGNLADVFAIDPFILPIDGEPVAFPGEVSADAYRLMMRTMSVAVRAAHGTLTEGETLDLTEEQAEQIRAEMLGDQAELVDGLHPKLSSFVETTLLLWHTQGQDAALSFWNTGGRGNRPAANRQERRAAAKGKGSKKKGTSSKS